MSLLPAVYEGWPPEGWAFYQPETDWHAPMPLQYRFEEQVQNIITMRKANPRFNLATDFETVAKQLGDYTCARLGHHKKYCVQIDEAQKKTSLPTAPLQRKRQEAVEGAAVGRGFDPRALVEWLGEGGIAVPSRVSERRAEICAQCPENSKSPTCPPNRRNSWTRWFTAPVAASIRRYLAVKNEMNLETTLDKKLGKCLACQCELTLKVHTPAEIIRSNTYPEIWTELAKVKNCWVMNE